MNRRMTYLWFLLGFGSKLQVVASLSITEIIVLAAAPFLFIHNYHQMKKDGVWLFFVLSLMVIVGCIVASIANHTSFQYVLRGMAVTCIVSCSIIFSHWILRRDPGGFKWFILGLPFSAIVSTFYFKTSVEMAMLGESAEEIMEGPLFWITRLNPIVLAPTKGWYLHMPWFVNVGAPLFMAGFSALTTVSGRSAALGAVCFAAMVLVGGKTRRRIGLISRHFGKLIVGGILLVGAMYVSYKTAAAQGLLGEDARKKYEIQTEGGAGGIGRLILGGRGDSFIGLLACRDKPIVGWGPWAMDEHGYIEEFMMNYGTFEDAQNWLRMNEWRMKNGITQKLLPCHAYITEFWAWYGIWGLIFWLYVIFVLLRYLKQDVAAVPQWFAWVACSLPGVLWGIFFSPFQDRFGLPLCIVACLMAKAVRQGRFKLPTNMIQEIEKVERK